MDNAEDTVQEIQKSIQDPIAQASQNINTLKQTGKEPWSK